MTNSFTNILNGEFEKEVLLLQKHSKFFFQEVNDKSFSWTTNEPFLWAQWHDVMRKSLKKQRSNQTSVKDPNYQTKKNDRHKKI